MLGGIFNGWRQCANGIMLAAEVTVNGVCVLRRVLAVTPRWLLVSKRLQKASRLDQPGGARYKPDLKLARRLVASNYARLT